MNPRQPETWRHLSEHPQFAGGVFDPDWYDGDADHDLARLAELAKAIRMTMPECTPELQVLDDGTMYLAVSHNAKLMAEIGPSQDADDRWCYFVDIADDEREHTVRHVADVLTLLHHLIPTPEQAVGM